MLARADVVRMPLPVESVDLVFTDPPYSKDALPLYGWLAQEAARVLRPGGFLLAMCGGVYMDQLFKAIEPAALEFFWCYQVWLSGDRAGVYWHQGNNQVPVTTRVKPVLAFSKGFGLPRTGTLGLVRSDGADKRFHHWGQNVSSARYFIDCFTHPGDLVCDPMLGGGTTGVACQLLGRRFVGFDIDPAALKISAHRLANSDAVLDTPLFNASVYDQP